MVRWLQELIFLMDTRSFVASGFEVRQADAGRVEATLRGYRYKPEERAAEVKAATLARTRQR